MNNSLQQYKRLLADYLRPQRGRVLALAVLMFSNIGLQLINPQIMRRFLDQATSGAALRTLTTLALIFMLLAITQQVVAVGTTYLGENVAWTATDLLRYDLARHCLRLDMAFHTEHTPGEMIERIDGDVNALTQFFSQFILQVLGNGILLLGVLVLLFREAATVGITLTVFVVVTLLILNQLRNAAVPFWKRSRAASADYFGFVEERLAGMEDIRALGMQSYVLRRFFELIAYLLADDRQGADPWLCTDEHCLAALFHRHGGGLYHRRLALPAPANDDWHGLPDRQLCGHAQYADSAHFARD